MGRVAEREAEAARAEGRRAHQGAARRADGRAGRRARRDGRPAARELLPRETPESALDFETQRWLDDAGHFRVLRHANVLRRAASAAKPAGARAADADGAEWAAYLRDARSECAKQKLAELTALEQKESALTRRLVRQYLRHCREQRGEPGKALEPFAPWVAGWLGEQKAHHKKVREWRREKAQISARQKVDRGRMAPVKKLEEQLKKMADDLFDEPPPHGAGLEFGHDIHQPKIMRPTRFGLQIQRRIGEILEEERKRAQPPARPLPRPPW